MGFELETGGKPITLADQELISFLFFIYKEEWQMYDIPICAGQ